MFNCSKPIDAENRNKHPAAARKKRKYLRLESRHYHQDTEEKSSVRALILGKILVKVIRKSLPLTGKRGGLMVSTLVSGSGDPGSSPSRGHCAVFLGEALYSRNASLLPGV